MKKIWIIALLSSASAFAQTPPGPGNMPNLEEMFFQQFDTDNNGEVSKEEFMKPTEAQFDHMDTDGNGSLDKQEIAAFNQAMQQRMREMQQKFQQQQQGMPPR